MNHNTQEKKLKTKVPLPFLLIALTLFAFVVVSCTQDSIFYDISNEPEPKEPIIPGSPTNMVVVNNQVFVGTRMGTNIHRYGNTDGVFGWTSIPLAGGSLGDIATDGKDLFVLAFPSGNPRNQSAIRRYNLETGVWEESLSLTEYSIQTLYGAGGKIFAGAQFKPDYENNAILYFDPDTISLTIAKYDTSLLSGAATDSAGNIYLATQGSGIFRYIDGSALSEPEYGTEGGIVTGIMEINGQVIAVTSDGTVYTLATPGNFFSFSTSLMFTGAMCVWTDRESQWKPSLLLMGIRNRGSSLTQGYREMVIDQSTGRPIQTIKMPGDDSPTSVKNKAKYTAGIGTHPIQAILQIPDVSRGGPLDYRAFSGDPEWEPPIFAATSRDGLWAYRNGEWNAEE